MSFKGFLKQSTAATIMLGPFLDTGDGNTYEGSMTLEDTEIWLSKNGGAFANPNNTDNATVDASVAAYYTKALSTTDTNTCGILRVVAKDSAALICDDSYQIVEESIYDSFYAASAAGFDSNQRVNVGQWLSQPVTLSTGNKPDVNVDEISDDATAASNLETACDGGSYNLGGGAVVAASVTGNVGGNVAGSVASVTGNVGGNVAGSVGSVTGAVGSVTAGVTLANGAHGGAGASLTLSDYSAFKATGFSTHSAADVKTAMEAEGSSLATLLSRIVGTIAAGTHTAQTGDGYAVVSNGTYGNSALKTLVDALTGYVDTEMAAVLAAVDTEVAAILAALTDSQAEPGQGAPPASATPLIKLAYLYKAWRNKKDQDGSYTQIYNDGGTVVDHKAATSVADSTVTVGQMATGA